MHTYIKYCIKFQSSLECKLKKCLIAKMSFSKLRYVLANFTYIHTYECWVWKYNKNNNGC